MRKKGKAGSSFENPVNEQQFRRSLLQQARNLGCEGDLIQIFEKFDKALKGCTNEQEIRHIQVVGAAEVHKLFGCRGGLTVNGWTIIPAEEGYENKGGSGKFSKL